MKTSLFLRFLLLAVFTLAACAPAQKAAPAYAPEPAFAGGAAEAPMAPDAVYEQASLLIGVLPDSASTRLVIQNVSLSLTVVNPETSLQEITRLAESLGGYVVSTNLRQETTESGIQAPRGSITVRVPQEKLDEALQQIKAGAGEVNSENRTGQDVTKEYTDLASRLRNLESAEKQLSQILQQAQTAEETLNVFNQLTSIREQIEVIKGQMQYYEQAAALSAIDIDLIAEASVQPLQLGGWRPQGTARDALQLLINFLKGFGDFLIFLVIFLLPAGALIIASLAVVWRVLRWLWRKLMPKKAQ